MSIDLVTFIANDRELCDEILIRSPHLIEKINALVKQTYAQQVESATANSPKDIEVLVDASTLAKLFELTVSQWKFVGENRPHHSVLSENSEYLPEKLTKDKAVSMTKCKK